MKSIIIVFIIAVLAQSAAMAQVAQKPVQMNWGQQPVVVVKTNAVTGKKVAVVVPPTAKVVNQAARRVQIASAYRTAGGGIVQCAGQCQEVYY